jgi:hypothetical protein
LNVGDICKLHRYATCTNRMILVINSYPPTVSPTKSPWSETAFVTFLYGESNIAAEEDGGTSSGSTNDEMLASQVSNGLENFNELQFHFFCGYSWDHGEYFFW